mmetsp:Transcript_15855/g.44360  ORF Transcript_15855/g.44360 Transcript_15855/m.44360 type:complete len:329 (-) Transcript_15855:227-1213(-)
MVGLRGVHAHLFLVRHDALDHGLLLLDHPPQRLRARHDLVLKLGCRGAHCRRLDHVPHGRPARAWRRFPDGDRRPVRDLHRPRHDVRAHRDADHYRRRPWRCGLHHPYAHRAVLPHVLRGEACDGQGSPPGQGVRRPPLQPERGLRLALLVADRLPARHVSRGATEDQRAAREGAKGSRQQCHRRRPLGQGGHDALVLLAHHGLHCRPRLGRPADWPRHRVRHGRANVDVQPRPAALVSCRPVVRLGARSGLFQALRSHHAAAWPLGLAEGLGPSGSAGVVGLGHVRLRPGGRCMVVRTRGPAAPSGRSGLRREHLVQGPHRIRPERA